MAMFTPEEDNLIDFLEEKFGCHTLILYGSRAIGTHQPESDWDVLGLYRGSKLISFHQAVPGVGEVNAYIYPESWAQYNARMPSPLYHPAEDFVRLKQGKVLTQELNWGDYILQQAKKIYEQGPPALTEEEREQMRYHVGSHLLDVVLNEARDPAWRNLAYHRIMTLCFRFYFQYRQLWVPSGRDGFAYIRTHDDTIYRQFLVCETQRDKAPLETLIAMVTNV